MKLWKEEQLPRVEKERKSTLRGKWENAITGEHMGSVRKETLVVSVMNRCLETGTRLRDDQDNRPLAHQIRRPRQTGKNPLSSENRGQSPWDKRNRILADLKIVKKNRHVTIGILTCVKITSLRQDVYMAKDASLHMLRRRRSPAKSQRRVVRKDQLPY